MLTSPWSIRLRNITRRIGLNKLVGSLLPSNHYEDRFGPAFRKQIRPGDTVWDIGANLGLYTTEFLETTGGVGRVVAFEPTAQCFFRLRELFADSKQVVLKNIAVGDTDGVIKMAVDNDPLAATHRVVTEQIYSDEEFIEVNVRSATSIVADEPDLFPNIVKIDVEGHEGAVLNGFTPLLADKRLHCIGIEVHFGLLDQRGESARPKQMEETLVSNGFKVNWTDSSHLIATR